MDRVLSARVDDSAIVELSRATRKLGITKKEFLEQAIHFQAERLRKLGEADIWEETLGAWKRKESPAALRKRARVQFNRSFSRRHV